MGLFKWRKNLQDGQTTDSVEFGFKTPKYDSNKPTAVCQIEGSSDMVVSSILYKTKEKEEPKIKEDVFCLNCKFIFQSCVSGVKTIGLRDPIFLCKKNPPETHYEKNFLRPKCIITDAPEELCHEKNKNNDCKSN